MATVPNNLILISETGADNVDAGLRRNNIYGGHFTNGTYAYAKEMIVPTVLAGFQHAVDAETTKGVALIVAVNSDKSMAAIMDKKIALGAATEADKAALEDQNTRALKVALPLSQQNPNRQVVAVFYDEETPNKLYDGLKAKGFGMETLFKWGYGTGNNTGVIEGAENFRATYGHPLPNDTQPVCADITRIGGQRGNVQVVDLRAETGSHGKPYISPKNEILSPLPHKDLQVYGVRHAGPTRPDPSGSGKAPAATPK